MGLEVVIAFTIPPFAGTKNDFLSAKSSSISNIIFIEDSHTYIRKFVFKRLSSYFWTKFKTRFFHGSLYTKLKITCRLLVSKTENVFY